MLDRRGVTRVLRTVIPACVLIAIAAPPATTQPEADVTSRLQLVRSWIVAGRYADAEAEAERLLASRTAPAGDDTPDPGREVLVEALIANGRGADLRTRTLAEQAVRAREAQAAQDQTALGRSVRNLGEVSLHAGDFQGAVASFTRALTHLEPVRDQTGPDMAETLDGLARSLMWLERYDGAIAALDRALALKEKLLRASDPAVARTLEVRALLRQRTGAFPAARVDLDRALAIREVAQPGHPELAVSLTLFGEQLWLEGDLIGSRRALLRALAVAERALRPEHPDIASSLRSLAIPVSDLGDSADAKMFRERGLAIAEKAFGPDHPLVAIQLNDLAISVQQQGDYAEGRRLYERALTIYERRLGPTHIGVTTAIYNLALLNSYLGDLFEATRLLQRAIRTWERTLGADHPNVARSLFVFGLTLAEQGRDREALPYLRRALAIRERALGRDHPTVARTLSNLSASLARLGETREADALSARALDIWAGSAAPDAAGLSESLLVHATGLGRRRDYAGAKQAYERALALQRPLYGATHPRIAEIGVGLASVLASMGQPQGAMAEAIHAEEIGRNHLRLTLGSLPERQALGYAASRPKGLDVALSLMSSAREEALAFDAVVRGRALVLDEVATRRQARARGAADDVSALWATLASTRQRLANLVVRGPTGQGAALHLTLVEAARREKEEAERNLAQQSAAFRVQLARAEIGLDDLRRALPDASALVSFVRYERSAFDRTAAIPSYVAFVLRPGAADPIAVPLGRADATEALIARWRSGLMPAVALVDVGSRQAEATSFRTLGTTVRQRIWDPLGPHLSGVARVYVVPDGALNLVPFAALPVSRTEYLLERGPVIHYLSSERDLVQEPPRETSRRGLLALGGAAFADGSSFAALARGAARQGGQPDAIVASRNSMPAAPSPDRGFRGTRSACASFRTMRFASLPASGREVREVAEVWEAAEGSSATAGESVQILTGASAREQAFKRLAPDYRVLHLATHGFFLDGLCASAIDGTRAVGGLTTAVVAPARPRRPSAPPENPLLLSGLALAGANRRASASADEDDGILTAEEVASLDLEGVEWAVLSACDTGVGEVRAGEGVLGLRRAFHVAGVRTIIMSLWSVDDQAARAWMRALYEGRFQRHLSTADAVHAASLTTLQARRANGQSTHPFYWAAFVAAGDWR